MIYSTIVARFLTFFRLLAFFRFLVAFFEAMVFLLLSDCPDEGSPCLYAITVPMSTPSPKYAKRFRFRAEAGLERLPRHAAALQKSPTVEYFNGDSQSA